MKAPSLAREAYHIRNLIVRQHAMPPAVWESRGAYFVFASCPHSLTNDMHDGASKTTARPAVNRPIRSRSTSACSSAWGDSSDCPSESWPWRLTRTSEGPQLPRRWLLLRAGRTWRVFFFCDIREGVHARMCGFWGVEQRTGLGDARHVLVGADGVPPLKNRNNSGLTGCVVAWMHLRQYSAIHGNDTTTGVFDSAVGVPWRSV